jgi:hypothetical protein
MRMRSGLGAIGAASCPLSNIALRTRADLGDLRKDVFAIERF